VIVETSSDKKGARYTYDGKIIPKAAPSAGGRKREKFMNSGCSPTFTHTLPNGWKPRIKEFVSESESIWAK
jgi:hypothetical protein